MSRHPELDSLIGATDWANLYHAYGWADDTPGHLRALLSDHAKDHSAALNHLNSAVIHQGTPWTCTAPAALVVASLLSHPQLAAIDATAEPKRRTQPASNVPGFAELAAHITEIGADGSKDADTPPLSALLISFLNEVAAGFPNSGATIEELEQMAATAPILSPDFRQKLIDQAREESDPDEEDEELDEETVFEMLFEDEEAANALHAYSVLSCARIRGQLLEKTLPSLVSPHRRTRSCAAEAIATLASQISPTDQLADLVRRLTEAARNADSPSERCAHVLALGTLTPDRPSPTAPFLEDPAPAVRLCAALAPAQAQNQNATQLLLDALARHAHEIEAWFTPKPPQFEMHVRFRLLHALLERTSTYDEIAPAALALIPRTTKYTVDHEWGLLMERAFPEGAAALPLTPSRREFFTALVGNAELWDPRNGNAGRWFKKTGLPRERATCQKLLTP